MTGLTDDSILVLKEKLRYYLDGLITESYFVSYCYEYLVQPDSVSWDKIQDSKAKIAAEIIAKGILLTEDMEIHRTTREELISLQQKLNAAIKC